MTTLTNTQEDRILTLLNKIVVERDKTGEDDLGDQIVRVLNSQHATIKKAHKDMEEIKTYPDKALEISTMSLNRIEMRDPEAVITIRET